MQLLVEKDAARRLLDLPPKRRADVLAKLEAIARDPFAAHANVKPLRGEKSLFRLRLGDWRAIYRVDKVAKEMRVLRLEPRGEVYR